MLNKKIWDDKIMWVDGKEKYCEIIFYYMNVVNLLIRKCNELIEEYEIEYWMKVRIVCVFRVVLFNF